MHPLLCLPPLPVPSRRQLGSAPLSTVTADNMTVIKARPPMGEALSLLPPSFCGLLSDSDAAAQTAADGLAAAAGNPSGRGRVAHRLPFCLSTPAPPFPPCSWPSTSAGRQWRCPASTRCTCWTSQTRRRQVGAPLSSSHTLALCEAARCPALSSSTARPPITSANPLPPPHPHPARARQCWRGPSRRPGPTASSVAPTTM